MALNKTIVERSAKRASEAASDAAQALSEGHPIAYVLRLLSESHRHLKWAEEHLVDETP